MRRLTALIPKQRIAAFLAEVRDARAERRHRKRRIAVMKPYTDLQRPLRKVMLFVLPVGLALFSLVYGFFFALTAPYLIVPFTVPVVVLVLLSIWALPDRAHAPTRSMELFFAALIISLVMWPNYLALSLPGLPWVTMLRLTGFPMAFLLLICLSTSEKFRAELRQTFGSVPGLWQCLLIFVVMQFVTIALSKAPPAAMQRALLQQVNWTSVFVVAAWVCRTPGQVGRYIALIVLLALPIIVLTFIEGRVQHVLWAGSVPSFLKVDDPTAALILSSAIRGATGLYRTKATFSTPLGLAEYLALLTPFALHYAFGNYRLIVRLFSAAMVPVLFYCIRLTDARLGVVGFGVSILLYFLFWGLLRLRRNRRDLVAAAIVYAYPAVFCAAAVAVMAVHRLNTMVFGGGAQAASNDARKNQLRMGIPKIFENPIGHGPGGSGPAMGYGADQFITIDNYYLTLALDYGVIGIVAFLAMFLLVIGASAKAGVQGASYKDRELTYAVPLSIALSAFLVIKLVFSQNDNHPLVFMMLGMAVALVGRVRLEASRDIEQAKERAPPPTDPRKTPALKTIPRRRAI